MMSSLLWTILNKGCYNYETTLGHELIKHPS